MKNIDWEKAFGERPENFHDSVNSALSEISNREENNMSKISLKKKVIITAAAVMALGATAIAAGKATSMSAHSYLNEEVKTVSEIQKMSDDEQLGVKYIDEFSNGFKFERGIPVYGDATDDNGYKLKEYTGFSLSYSDGENEVQLYVEPNADINEMPENAETEVINGKTVYIKDSVYKFVPPDYEKTEQDIADEEAGKIYISYGTDEVQIKTMRNVIWEDGAIVFDLLDNTATVSAEELVNMASEMIEAQAD